MKDEGKDHAVRILDEGNYSGLSTHESDIHSSFTRPRQDP